MISVITATEGIWDGFNAGADKRCKVTYVAPEGSQVAINFLDMDMVGEGVGAGDCDADYVKLTEAADTAYSLIGGLTLAKTIYR